MKPAFLRQLFLIIALFAYANQVVASVAISHLPHDQAADHVSGAESHLEHLNAGSCGQLCHDHQSHTASEDLGLADHDPIHPDCGDQCDCGVGHCSSAALVSSPATAVPATVYHNTRYTDSYGGTTALSPFKPPIAR